MAQDAADLSCFFARDADADAPAATAATVTPDKPYHAKRPHKKSRAGCKNCKVRKVKCDEARPTCRSCRLRKAECEYPAAPLTDNSHRHATPSHSLPSPAASSCSSATSPASAALTQSSRKSDPGIVVQPLFRPTPDIDKLDMKLLWFYTSKTAYSFSVEHNKQKPVEDIMKNVLVRYAFDHPFLMDSLFALSCLHLQSLQHDFDPDRALTYRARSFEGYRRAVEEAKPETFPALLANSLLLTALSSQTFREPDSKPLYILDWMVVWRGIGLIFDLISMPSLGQSGLDALFYRPAMDLDLATAAIPNSLLFMVSSIKQDDPDYPHMQLYYDTLKYLGSLYLNLRDGFGPVMNLRIITWFTFIPRDFLPLAQERRPRALVILAHYSIFLKIIRDVWWYAGIGERSLRDICQHLDSGWHYLLKMPLMALHLNTPLDLARLILEDADWVSSWAAHPLDRSREGETRFLTWVDNTGRKIRFRGEEQYDNDTTMDSGFDIQPQLGIDSI